MQLVAGLHACVNSLKVVIVIGSSASAVDICRDIAGVAKEVHIASRSVANETYKKQPGYHNLRLQCMVESAHEDGTVVFRNGKVVPADIIMHCTRRTQHKYHYPFLDTKGIVTVDDNRVGPLYKKIFPPALAPWLSFIGIPRKIVTFPLFELQSKWVAGILSGRITLPRQEEMMDDIAAFYSSLEASGIPKRDTHLMGDSQNRIRRPETYRDEWEDHELVLKAHEDFVKYTSKQKR
ncbi:Flavin monooxygenase-like protein [Corchorus capsularis]|uniref:Flavin-containing monooxygenase n=1 Tax=Corchorus capsularis TaxID=210143 RepID=A0A1R3HNJ5_COCAP|nr:Flavin monooxygenase-like protein [Corchorus capsularis]